MPVRRGEKWEGRLKTGGRVIKTRRFPTKREAAQWESRARTALTDDGYDPRNGRQSVEALLDVWIDGRIGRLSPTTVATDRYLKAALPTWMLKLDVGAVTRGHIDKIMVDWLERGLVATSVNRYRSSLSPFFAWLTREGYVPKNIVAQVKPIRDQRPQETMHPLNEHELADVIGAVAVLDKRSAQIIEVLAWTGLRWGEARAIRVRDVTQLPMPMFNVRRNRPEGTAERTTKSGKARQVPLVDTILPIIHGLADGKDADDLLLTTAHGGQLHRGRFVRTVNWAVTGRGRTLHDLRHTAACLWLSKGVPLGTVQAWLGHADVATTNRYLHHLGDYADRSALALLNSRGDSRVTVTREEDAS